MLVSQTVNKHDPQNSITMLTNEQVIPILRKDLIAMKMTSAALVSQRTSLKEDLFLMDEELSRLTSDVREKQEKLTTRNQTKLFDELLNRDRSSKVTNIHFLATDFHVDNSKQFVCKENGCGKRFAHNCRLLEHFWTFHTDETVVKCSFRDCRKTFRTLPHLTLHMRTHTGEKPYACNECPKAFASHPSLKAHSRMHTNGKPFKCYHDGCNKAFNWQKSLFLHELLHRGEKPYSCNVPDCRKSFVTPERLRTHSRRYHTGEKPFKCGYDGCTKRFVTSSERFKHRRTHTGERPHVCNECGKSFAVSSNLNAHKRIHSGMKPFVCSKCSKSFTRSSARKAHEKKCVMPEEF